MLLVAAASFGRLAGGQVSDGGLGGARFKMTQCDMKSRRCTREAHFSEGLLSIILHESLEEHYFQN